MKKIAACIAGATLIAGCCAFFAGCNKNTLDYAVTEDSCAVVSGVNYIEKELVVPSVHEGKPVTGVLEYSFVRNASIVSVTLPDGASFIGKGAFYSCFQMTSVTLPATLTHIGYNAFSYCEKLETINFSGTKEQWYAIEKEYLWDDYSGNYSIVCTDGTLSKAQNGNDLGTTGLIYEIYLKTWHCVLTNGLNTGKAKDIQVSAKYYNYPVTVIGERAFEGTDIKSIKIPEGVLYIENAAFKSCDSLTTVYLPSSIGNIGSEAFGGCKSLSDIHFSGTRAQWNELSRDPDWDYDAAAYTVHCTDDE